MLVAANRVEMVLVRTLAPFTGSALMMGLVCDGDGCAGVSGWAWAGQSGIANVSGARDANGRGNDASMAGEGGSGSAVTRSSVVPAGLYYGRFAEVK